MVFTSEAERRHLGCGWETKGQKNLPTPRGVGREKNYYSGLSTGAIASLVTTARIVRAE